MKQRQNPKTMKKNDLMQSLFLSNTGATKVSQIFLNFTQIFFLSRLTGLFSITNNRKLNNRLTEHGITNQLAQLNCLKKI